MKMTKDFMTRIIHTAAIALSHYQSAKNVLQRGKPTAGEHRMVHWPSEVNRKRSAVIVQ